MTTPGGGKRCAADIRFPRRLWNRPALPRIDYRIGTFADIRQRLFRELDLAPELAEWTHREADDPGIALLEGAAILGDILTFYQDLYANEGYLRTADWRESVTDLVRLLGYRLAPGLGGRGDFAIEVKGDRPVVLPAGFPLQAELEPMDDPADFETISDSVAYPALSRFSLYRPLERPSISSGTRELRVLASEGLSFEEGDRLMVGRPSSWSSSEPTLSDPQVVVVEDSWSLHGQTMLRIRGSLSLATTTTALRAYRLGRSFRHFGHNAPRQEVTLDGSGNATATTTPTERSLVDPTNGSHVDPELGAKQFPLEPPADDLTLGGLLVGDTWQKRPSDSSPSRNTRVATIGQVTGRSMRWGSLSGPTSLVELKSSINTASDSEMDIRSAEFHEVLGAALALDAAPRNDTGVSVGQDLFYAGSFADLEPLVGRRILLAKPGEVGRLSTVVDVFEDDSDVPDFPRLHRVRLADDVTLSDFPQQEPDVDVFGNVVTADQGKSEKEAVLGDGDGRQEFQTFTLPKPPLTYHYQPSSTPPQGPELEVYVDGRMWTQVDSLYGKGGTSEVYIVREDDDGASYLQFGDGELLGARLPTGFGNVTAVYRTGVGAHGAKKVDTKVIAKQRLERLDKVQLETDISGGEEPETADKARRSAPGRVQSLNRVVSLKDYESEALAIPGVVLASARWGLEDNVPVVIVTVLMASGREGEFEAVRGALETTNRCRGAHRHTVIVRPGAFEYVYLEAEVAIEVGRLSDPVIDAVEKALGLVVIGGESSGPRGGLFGLDRRRFGMREYSSRVTATIQNVDGVVWAKVTALQGVGDSFAVPATPVLVATLPCPSDRVLRLESPVGASAARLEAVTAGPGVGGDHEC